MIPIYIYGTGGFAAEVDALIRRSYSIDYQVKAFIDLPERSGGKFRGLPIEPHNFLSNLIKPHVVIAAGSPNIRKKIYQSLPEGIIYPTLLDRSVQLLAKDISFGQGSIICANCVITTNCSFGKFTQLNLGTTVGHDCIIGDYFTTAPLVSISGNNQIQESVYFGTHACSIEKINICSDVTIGANACVIKNIELPGTYVGTPAKLLKKD